ncbi:MULTISPECIES: hypothetical protein [Bradyrhizobium]|uniref:hypothetical protein n=1 Tax=Bradyrhizobium TaxID=374 RepID=UPI001B8A7987|nr:MULTISPECIES: hypothetical protein [Bradyrhizobium]MBR0975109.1 hypothetical protein [Bradyrhizobium japonicum]
MPAYLVRSIDTHQIVGFFFADHPRGLALLVQDWTDGDLCEYVQLPGGGIVWAGSAVPVPMDPGIEDDADWNMPELPFTSATLSETWLNVLYGYTTKLRWTRFKAGKRPESTSPEPPEPVSSGQVIPLRRPQS